MLKYLFLSFLFVSCAVSYNAKNPTTKEILPSNATDIVDLGNDWLTFKLPVNGKTKCFLFHREYRWDLELGFEAITELSDCKK